MSAFIIASLEVKDPERYEEYRKQVKATVDAHGGEFLARGGALEILEGTWPRPRAVIIRFESMDKARAWYNSDAYRPLRDLRQSASEGTLILLEGVE